MKGTVLTRSNTADNNNGISARITCAEPLMSYYTERSPQKSSSNTTVGVSGRERRREPRFAVRAPCYLVWSEKGSEVCAHGVIQDLSANGLRVRTRPRAATGDEIHVFIGDREIVTGEVRHCAQNEDGTHDIGILITKAFSDFTPPAS
ncbi:MAG TPA: PilZ domain-containing protein [Bryobacteraceae bacterium]|nr:PilZ domain-containing protein [Bryobacteraceae bacterium]